MSLRRISESIQLELPTSEKLILLLLANSANDETGECFPSQKYLSKKSGLARETVNRLIRKLQKKGHVAIRHKYRDDGGMRSNTYTVMPYLSGGSDQVSQGDVTDSHRGVCSDVTAIDTHKETPINIPMTGRPNGNLGKSAAGRARLAEERVAHKSDC